MTIDEKVKTLTLCFIFQQAAENILGADVCKTFAERPANKVLEQKRTKGMLRKLMVNQPRFLLAVMFGNEKSAKKHEKDAEEFLADKYYVPFLDYAEKMMNDIYPIIDKDKFFERAVQHALNDEKERVHTEFSENLERWIAIFEALDYPQLQDITVELKARMEGKPNAPQGPIISKAPRSQIILK